MLITRITSIGKLNSLQEAVRARNNSRFLFQGSTKGARNYVDVEYDMSTYYVDVLRSSYENKTSLIKALVKYMKDCGWKNEDGETKLNKNINFDLEGNGENKESLTDPFGQNEKKELHVSFVEDGVNSYDEIENLKASNTEVIAYIQRGSDHYEELINENSSFIIEYKGEEIDCMINKDGELEIETDIDEEFDFTEDDIESEFENKYIVKTIKAKDYNSWIKVVFVFKKEDEDKDEVKVLDQLNSLLTRAIVLGAFEVKTIISINGKEYINSEYLEDAYGIISDKGYLSDDEKDEYINDILSQNNYKREDFSKIEIKE